MTFRFRRHHEDPTPDQRERMAVFSLSGETEGPVMMLAQRRLEFSRDLARHGRISEDAVTTARERVWTGLGEPQGLMNDV